MSVRRSLSFDKNEDDLLQYFDENGRSKIAKEAMKFYIKHKDNVLTEPMINLLKIIGTNNKTQIETPKPNINNKLSKLMK